MMLYLTGAAYPVTKNPENANQSDPSRSLGGFVSSTPVPSGGLNTLFDTLSLKALSDKKEETVAIALVNEIRDVQNLNMSVRTEEGMKCRFLFAFVLIETNTLSMERIASRYQEPMYLGDSGWMPQEDFEGDGELLLENFEKGSAVGIWIKRVIKDDVSDDNDKMLEDYRNNITPEETEEIELIFTYI